MSNARCNVAGAFVKPNGIRFYSKAPSWHTKAVVSQSSDAMETCQ